MLMRYDSSRVQQPTAPPGSPSLVIHRPKASTTGEASGHVLDAERAVCERFTPSRIRLLRGKVERVQLHQPPARVLIVLEIELPLLCNLEHGELRELSWLAGSGAGSRALADPDVVQETSREGDATVE